MRVLILNGNPKSENQRFDNYLDKLSSVLIEKGNEVVTLKLREMKINYCIGCYTCWLKTPGICVFKDDGPEVLTEYLKSDVVLFTSPVIMGFVSALLKGVQERFLPLVHPFLCVNEDRMQHLPRYEKYPALAVLLDKPDNYDEVSSEIIDKVFKGSKNRNFLFTKTMDQRPEEVAYAINGI